MSDNVKKSPYPKFESCREQVPSFVHPNPSQVLCNF